MLSFCLKNRSRTVQNLVCYKKFKPNLECLAVLIQVAGKLIRSNLIYIKFIHKNYDTERTRLAVKAITVLSRAPHNPCLQFIQAVEVGYASPLFMEGFWWHTAKSHIFLDFPGWPLFLFHLSRCFALNQIEFLISIILKIVFDCTYVPIKSAHTCFLGRNPITHSTVL